MAAKKFSQLDEVVNLTGQEEVPVAYEGNNYKFKLRNLKNVLTKSDVGLDQVNNTSDLDKPVSTATASAINGKANLHHSHELTEVTGLITALNDKANADHEHLIGSVSGLQNALDLKSDIGHLHPLSELPEVQTALDQKAALSHNHNLANITGLQMALDQKAAFLHAHQASDIVDFVLAVEDAINQSDLPLGDVSVNKLEW